MRDRRHGKRDREECPRCRKMVAVSPVNGSMRKHYPPCGGNGMECESSGYSTVDARAHLYREGKAT